MGRGRGAPSAVRVVGANRADLGEPRWVQALTGHRDELVSVSEADVGPELDRALGYEANYAGTSFLTTDKLGKFRVGSDIVNFNGDRTRVVPA